MKNQLRTILLISIIQFLLYNCSPKPTEDNKDLSLDSIAEAYVRLVLQLGEYIPDYVDAYYGPEELRTTLETSEEIPVDGFNQQVKDLIESLDDIDESSLSQIQTLRCLFLRKQLLSVKSKIDEFSGKKLTFDQEAKALYDAIVPHFTSTHYQLLISELNELLPGEGSISDRLDKFKQDYIIPLEKLDTVFQVAINEAKKRTLKNVILPSNESFKLEYVTNKSWSGYNWYQGKSQSLIQINTDLPIYIDRAIDLACHEGYPGHHVYNCLLEKNLYVDRGWAEFSVYPLFSPQSLIAEGSANYGIDVAFPGIERIKFEQEVLFPLAGLSPEKAEHYYKVLGIVSKLNYSGNEAARDYLDGKITKEQAVNWLIQFSLMNPERAEQRIKFIEKYRSYVINYNLGKDLVRSYIEKNGGSLEFPEKRWELFKELLSNPKTPSGLLK